MYEKPHWRQWQFTNPLTFNWNSQRPLTTWWSRPVQDSVTLGRGGLSMNQAILLFWSPLCHVSRLVRRWDGPCYWKTHLSCSAHSLLSSYLYLISRREKRPISVIFYFAIKVSGEVKRRKCTINFYPGRTGYMCLCQPNYSLSVCFIHSLRSVCLHLSEILTWTVLYLAAKGRQSMIFFCLCFFLPGVDSVCSIIQSFKVFRKNGKQQGLVIFKSVLRTSNGGVRWECKTRTTPPSLAPKMYIINY